MTVAVLVVGVGWRQELVEGMSHLVLHLHVVLVVHVVLTHHFPGLVVAPRPLYPPRRRILPQPSLPHQRGQFLALGGLVRLRSLLREVNQTLLLPHRPLHINPQDLLYVCIFALVPVGRTSTGFPRAETCPLRVRRRVTESAVELAFLGSGGVAFASGGGSWVVDFDQEGVEVVQGVELPVLCLCLCFAFWPGSSLRLGSRRVLALALHNEQY